MFPQIKLIAMGVVALAIAGAVTYHFIVVSNRDSKIAELEQIRAALVIDKERLTASNTSLESRIKQLEDVNRQMIAEQANLRQADQTARNQVAAAEQRALSAENRARLARLRSGSGAGQLLGIINRDTECNLKHIMEDGECVAGQWRPSQRR